MQTARAALLFGAVLWIAVPAAAQTQGRASIGLGRTWIQPAHEDVSPTSSVGPIVRLNPGRGLGVAAALDWFEAEVGDETGHVGVLKVRPFLVGIGYGIPHGRLHTAVAVVAGPSFNRLHLAEHRAGEKVDIRTSMAVRPGLNMTYTLGPRVAVTGFGGYVFNRPEITYRTADAEYRDRWTADAVILSAGLVLSIF